SGVAAAGRSLLFQFEKGEYLTISSDFDRYQVKTDSEGRFVFPQVPPGHHKVVELVPEHGFGGGQAWSHHPLIDVEIRPGETTKVNLGGTGYKVTARLRWPAGQERTANSRIFAIVRPQAAAESSGSDAAIIAPALGSISGGNAPSPRPFSFRDDPD